MEERDAQVAIDLVQFAYFKRILKKGKRNRDEDDEEEEDEVEGNEESQQQEDSQPDQPAAKKPRLSFVLH